jgi:fumarylacetoacetate (FAA) hydrolase family protein
MTTHPPLPNTLPTDAERSLLVGRIEVPNLGPVLCLVTPQIVYDLSSIADTSADLLALPSPAQTITEKRTQLPRIADTAAVLANSVESTRNPAQPYFLAQAVRESIAKIVGDNLRAVVPGSEQAMKVKEVLLQQGLWSQYLEVGIGKDAEVFTKSQPMSAVGYGAQIGIHPESHWNNPEPEIVLAVSPTGVVHGVTLGNDVNLRDFEGRSALLLGKAKDNNASCAIGPFIRLFDAHFTMDDVRQCELGLTVTDDKGFLMEGNSAISQISRDPLDLVAQTINANHQYPDGFMLFLGTMFAPTQDRFAKDQGFTHAVGDVVSVHTPKLGCLTNQVNTSDQIAPWTIGVRHLIRLLAQRNALSN